jgi:hypothetical protein
MQFMYVFHYSKTKIINKIIQELRLSSFDENNFDGTVFFGLFAVVTALQKQSKLMQTS